MFGVEVTHIAKSVTSTWLQSTFSHCGKVERRPIDIHQGELENHAFIYFSSREDAEKAVEELHGICVDGMAIEVKLHNETTKDKPSAHTVHSNPVHNSSQGTSHVLKVSNIDKSVSEDSLKREFEIFPGFVSLKVMPAPSGPNYAWVNYSNIKGAQEACKLDGKTVQGVAIKVSFRRPSSAPLSPSLTASASELKTERKETVPKEFSFKVDPESNQGKADAPQNKSIFASSQTGIPISKLPVQTVAGSATSFSAGLWENIDRKPSHASSSSILPAGSTPPLKNAQTIPVPTKRSPSPHHHHVPAHRAKQSTHSQTKSKSSKSKSPKRYSLRSSSAPYQRPVSPQHHKQQQLKNSGGKVSIRETSKTIPQNAGLEYEVSRREGEGVNPFFAASVSSQSTQITSAPPVLPSRVMKLPYKLVYNILTCKLQSELENIIQRFEISWVPLENDCGLILSGACTNSLDGAEKAITELADQIQSNIVHQDLKLHCKYVPLLTTSEMRTELRQAEKMGCVQLSIVDQSGSMSDIEGFAEANVHTDGLPLKVEHLEKYTTTSYNWLAENDSGRFLPVSPEICAQINTLYIPQATVNFHHRGEEYIVDFASETLQEKTTGKNRQLRKDLNRAWYMVRDEITKPLSSEQSEMVERSYQYGSKHLKIEDHNCTADFKRMVLINMQTCTEYPLLRKSAEGVAIPSEPSLPERKITLRIHGLQDNMTAAVSEMQAKLAGDLVKVAVKLPEVASPEYGPAVASLVFNNARQYCVSVEHQGYNTITIHGEQNYVRRVEAVLFDQTQFLRKELNKIDYPSNWTEQTEECVFVVVSPKESIEVLKLMRKTLPKVSIKNLERIQHQPQWDRYMLQKKLTLRKNSDSPLNEKFLFHGTRNTNPREVVKSEKGIDFRHSREKSLWGCGSYFAVDASYSNANYAHKIDQYGIYGQCKQLIVSQVLTGLSKNYGTQSKPDLKMPPNKELPDGKTVAYDTVCGITNNSQVYVVYDHDRVYPAYIVTYQDN